MVSVSVVATCCKVVKLLTEAGEVSPLKPHIFPHLNGVPLFCFRPFPGMSPSQYEYQWIITPDIEVFSALFQMWPNN